MSSANSDQGGSGEDRPKGQGAPKTGAAAGSAGAPSPAGKRRRDQRPDRVPVGGRRLVSLAIAAAYADVSTRTLRRYISHGRLTGYRVGPRLVKVDLSEVDKLARPIPTARGPS